MKKSAFAFIAFLALAGVTFGSVSLSMFSQGSVGNATDGTPLTAYILRATGAGIMTLSEFSITTPVYQSFINSGFPEYTNSQSEWYTTNQSAGDYTATQDSYVMFGTLRLPDLNGGLAPGTDFATVETIGGAANPTEQSGWGTLNNSNAGTWDAYLNLNGVSADPNGVYDLMRLVLPTALDVNTGFSMSLKLYTATDYNPTTGAATITKEELVWPYVPPQESEPGDTNKDGFINLADLTNFGLGWFGPDGSGYVSGSGKTDTASWGTGDFDGNGVVNLADLTAFGTGWYGPNGSGYTGAAASAVPEPGTIAMLILGALCLLGYRLRK